MSKTSKPTPTTPVTQTSHGYMETVEAAQQMLKQEQDIAHLARMNLINEALILKTVDLIAKDATPEKIQQMIELLNLSKGSSEKKTTVDKQ